MELTLGVLPVAYPLLAASFIQLPAMPQPGSEIPSVSCTSCQAPQVQFDHPP